MLDNMLHLLTCTSACMCSSTSLIWMTCLSGIHHQLFNLFFFIVFLMWSHHESV
uniref:Uncharacterized protein n=1 Tax=Rhizophora mucronata TaxID=61149 RepID=A0A2P2N6S0_RHIMU